MVGDADPTAGSVVLDYAGLALPTPESAKPVSPALVWIMVLAIAGSAANFWLQSHQRPDGLYDAWAIWNLRARFIYAGSDEAFAAGFSHADYVPLWPMLIARIGWLMGGLSTAVPIVCGAVAAILNVGVLFFGVAWFAGMRAGILAAIVLMGTQEFINHAADQYADVPLACIFLSAGVVVAILLDSKSGAGIRTAIIAGLLAGIGALVKNEGGIYLIGLFAGLAAATFKYIRDLRRSGAALRFAPGVDIIDPLLLGLRSKFSRSGRFIEIGAFVAGAVPMLILLGVFKFAYAPPNDMVTGGEAFTVAHDIDSRQTSDESQKTSAEPAGADVKPLSLAKRLTDRRRYLQVFGSILRRFVRIDRWNIFLLAAVISLVIRPRTLENRPARLAIGIAILVTCTGYFAAYIATPHGLEWHINTSMNRLILQIWGILIFLICLRPLVSSAPSGNSLPSVVKSAQGF
jgi:hypothetical protein